MENNETDIICNYAGEGVGMINSIDSAYDLILGIENDAIATIKTMSGIIK